MQRSARGSVFTPATFTALGSRAAIDKALQRLVAKGELRRLSRGLYDKPRHDELLGTLWPSVDAVVQAVVGKDKLRVQPAGVYAANLLGLSEQVPAQVVLLTDGASRSVRAGPMHITLRRTSPRNMAAADRLSGRVIQAFKSLGPGHITPQHLEHLRKTLPAAER
ncbi:MAG: type IV toxin-antitoxin system AbiEi family antitoxin domain-containing protein, partial [Candidatus Rokubacteria bacterium]|nr:type IV toxin-antitoxin system AbiEi family antitoxin domain-containing protein [Candidatus Rokubacteria bacterium]